VESIIDDCGYIVDKSDIESVKKILYDIKNKVLQIPSKNHLLSVAHKEFNKDSKFLEYFKLYKNIIAN